MMMLIDVPLYELYLKYRDAESFEELEVELEEVYEQELVKLDEITLEPLESVLDFHQESDISKFLRFHNNSTTDVEAVRMFKKLTLPGLANKTLNSLKDSNHYELAHFHMRRVNADTETFVGEKKIYLAKAKSLLSKIDWYDKFAIREAIATYYEMFWWDLEEITE